MSVIKDAIVPVGRFVIGYNVTVRAVMDDCTQAPTAYQTLGGE
jgi:hypothetical protein